VNSRREKMKCEICKKEMLENIDDTYGCFTHSMGCNYSFDGVILGEVCFSQKITSLGWGWVTDPNVCTDIDRGKDI